MTTIKLSLPPRCIKVHKLGHLQSLFEPKNNFAKDPASSALLLFTPCQFLKISSAPDCPNCGLTEWGFGQPSLKSQL